MSKSKRAIQKSKGLFFLGAVALAFGLWPSFSHVVLEQRWYRDLMGLTPFRDVEVSSIDVTGDGVTVEGSMVKVRCVFVSLSAYVVFSNGLAVRVHVETTAEDARGTTGNRPASRFRQSWGPWKLWYQGGLGLPVGWEIHAHHNNCPSGQKSQTNLFAHGEWSNLEGGTK